MIMLLRRLEFRIKRIIYDPIRKEAVYHLSHCLSVDSDMQPLQVGQIIRFDETAYEVPISGVLEGAVVITNMDHETYGYYRGTPEPRGPIVPRYLCRPSQTVFVPPTERDLP